MVKFSNKSSLQSLKWWFDLEEWKRVLKWMPFLNSALGFKNSNLSNQDGQQLQVHPSFKQHLDLTMGVFLHKSSNNLIFHGFRTKTGNNLEFLFKKIFSSEDGGTFV